MTAETTGSPTADHSLAVSDELLDAMIEAVVLPPDARARSAVICRLVHELCATVEWLQRSHTGSRQATEAEMISIRRLASAAQDYRLRMAFGPNRVTPETR